MVIGNGRKRSTMKKLGLGTVLLLAATALLIFSVETEGSLWFRQGSWLHYKDGSPLQHEAEHLPPPAVPSEDKLQERVLDHPSGSRRLLSQQVRRLNGKGGGGRGSGRGGGGSGPGHGGGGRDRGRDRGREGGGGQDEGDTGGGGGGGGGGGDGFCIGYCPGGGNGGGGGGGGGSTPSATSQSNNTAVSAATQP